MLQSQTASHTEMNLDVGTYTISVFDLESDSTISTSTATEAQEVSISQMQPTTVPSAASESIDNNWHCYVGIVRYYKVTVWGACYHQTCI